MKVRKARTNEQKEREQDKRLQRKYGITLTERNARSWHQGYKCKICGGPLDPPCVDHFHFSIRAYAAVDPKMVSIGLKWCAVSYAEDASIVTTKHAHTKAAAIADVKMASMPWSIRGILCRRCNRALGMLERWFDAARHPDKVLPSLEYLRERLNKA